MTTPKQPSGPREPRQDRFKPPPKVTPGATVEKGYKPPPKPAGGGGAPGGGKR
jgi:hypothetical protein